MKNALRKVLTFVVVFASGVLGLCVATTTPVHAAPVSPYYVDVDRNFVSNTLTLRPGEAASVDFMITRLNLDMSTFNAGDTIVVTNSEVLGADVAQSYSSWNNFMSGGSWSDSSNGGSTPAASNILTWTSAADSNNANYFSMMYDTRIVNNSTTTARTYQINPTVSAIRGGVTTSLVAGTDFTLLPISASISVTASEYQAYANDQSIILSGDYNCLARDFAGAEFDLQVVTTEDGGALSGGVTVSRSSSVFDYSSGTTRLDSSSAITSYEVNASSELLLNLSSPLLVSSGNAWLTISGTSLTVGSFTVNGSRSWQVVSSTQIKYSVTSGVVANTALPTGARATTYLGIQLFARYATPANITSVRASVDVTVTSPVAGKTYTTSADFINPVNSASISRACGPTAPGAPTQSGTPTSSGVAVTIPQVSGATSYICGAFAGSSTSPISTGYLSESSRASGTACYIYGLSSSTTYTIKARAANSEGAGEYGSGVSVSTAASGGGGGGTITVSFATLGTPETGTDVSSAFTISGGVYSTLVGSQRNQAIADWGDGALISKIDSSAGSLTTSRLTPSGPDTDFGNSGVVTASASNVTWFGASGARKLALFGYSSGYTAGFADINDDTSATMASIDWSSYCNSQASGTSFWGGGFYSAPTSLPIANVYCAPNAYSGGSSQLRRYVVSVNPANNAVTHLSSIWPSYNGTDSLTTVVTTINPAATSSDVALTILSVQGQGTAPSYTGYLYGLTQILGDGTVVGSGIQSLTVSGSVPTAPRIFPRFNGTTVRAYATAVSGQTVTHKIVTVDSSALTISSTNFTPSTVSEFQVGGLDTSSLTPIGNGSGSTVQFLRYGIGSSGPMAAMSTLTVGDGSNVSTPVLATGVIISATLYGHTVDSGNAYSYVPVSSSQYRVVSWGGTGSSSSSGGGSSPSQLIGSIIDSIIGNLPTSSNPQLTILPVLDSVRSPRRTQAELIVIAPKILESKISFSANANSVAAPKASSIAKIAEVVKEGFGIRVVGSAGMQPGNSKKSVQALALKRANAIRDLLIKQGVDPESITIITKVTRPGKTPTTKLNLHVLGN